MKRITILAGAFLAVFAFLVGIETAPANSSVSPVRQAQVVLTPTPSAIAPASPVPGLTASSQPSAEPDSSKAQDCAATASSGDELLPLPSPLGEATPAASTSPSATDGAPVPVNPVMKECAFGRLVVKVQSERHFGHRIGEEIDLEISILADNNVTVDFSSLQQGILKFDDDSDFQLIPNEEAMVESEPYLYSNKKTLYTIKLPVQSFVTKPFLVFNLDLRYALDVKPSDNQPNWKILTTPDFVVTTSNTLDSGTRLLEGDNSLPTMRMPWLTLPAMVSGLILIFWFGGVKDLIARLSRLLPGFKITPEEKAWRVFDKVLVDYKEYGGELSIEYAKKIALALRTYLQVESLTIGEIACRTQSKPPVQTIVRALTKLDSVIYARFDQPRPLSEIAADELFQELTELVPRPKNL